MNNIVFDETLNNSCLIVLNLLVFLNIKSAVYNKRGLYTNYWVLWIFITTFSLYYRPLEGDFWYSFPEFKYRLVMYKEHMEPFYVWLKETVDFDYLLWRFIVWGSAGGFVCLLFKKLKIQPGIGSIAFLVFALLDSFYYMRNALGFGILYWGVSLFLANRSQSYLKRLILLLLVSGISYFFHRSMPLYILFSYIALFIPFNQKRLCYLVFLFPLLYLAVSSLATSLLAVDVWADDGGSYYMEQENTYSANWKGIVSLLIGYAPFIYISYYYIKNDFNSTDSESYARRTFFLIFFFLYYLSFLFTGQAAKDLAMRFGDSSMYPFAIFIALYFKRYAPSKICLYFALMMAFSVLCHFLFTNVN